MFCCTFSSTPHCHLGFDAYFERVISGSPMPSNSRIFIVKVYNILCDTGFDYTASISFARAVYFSHSSTISISEETTTLLVLERALITVEETTAHAPAWLKYYNIAVLERRVGRPSSDEGLGYKYHIV